MPASLSPELEEEARNLNIDFTDIEEKFKVTIPSPFDSFVVVDNLPVIPLSKVEKLSSVVKKIFGSAGKVKNIDMPDENDKTKGFAFIEFDSPESARAAIKVGNGYKLDAKHTLLVNFFNDIRNYTEISDEYNQPKIEEYEEKEHIRSWLKDTNGRDQWALLEGPNFGIYWNNKTHAPTKIHTRANWSDQFLVWSPLGSYVATFHKQGIVLWGGDSFERIVRFSHTFVDGICFSPKESYIITFSLKPFDAPDGDKHNFIVWDIASGRQLRSFKLFGNYELNNINGEHGIVTTFKWSHDEKYIARMVQEREINGKILPAGIQVYETPTMGLVNKKSIRIDNIHGFEWSPAENIISYWIPQQENIPGRIALVNPLNQQIIRTQNMLQMVGSRFYWNSDGDYLLCATERDKGKKGKTSIDSSFQIFHIHEKDVPVDILELGIDVPILDAGFEPRNSIFSFITVEQGVHNTYFYDVKLPTNKAIVNTIKNKKIGPFKLAESTAPGPVNRVTWSPAGRYCVFIGLNPQGTVQFWDAEEPEKLTDGDHPILTDFSWDPSGRFLTTSSSKWKAPTESGFMMWTATGDIMVRQMIPDYKILKWRPRPECFLKKDEQKKIIKNLREYSKKFDAEDASRSDAVNAELVDKRISLLKAWYNFVASKQADYDNKAETRTAIYGYNPDEPEEIVETIEEWFEELVDEKIETIN